MRKKMSIEERESASLLMASHFMNFLESFSKIQCIHIFLPIAKQREPNTFLISKRLFEAKKEVYTSVIHSMDEMQTVRLNPSTIFEEDALGIPIPKEVEYSDRSMIQLVLVPLLAYDIKGNRIGYGKGYYDKFLKSLKEDVLKVGLSYFPPEEMIQNEAHDIQLDYCISPQTLYSFD